MRARPGLASTALASVVLSLGCSGRIEEGGADDEGAAGSGDGLGSGTGPSSPGAAAGSRPAPIAPAPPPPAEFKLGATGLRRLSRAEYDNVLRDLLGDTTRPGQAKLPEDATDPFDNDYTSQIASGVLVESFETLATEAAARTLADPARRTALVSCTPTGPDDAACLRKFITTFGRRALRRPLAEEEIAEYLKLRSFAVERKDFYVAVSLVLRAMLQDPELVYQVEIGAPVAGRPGLFRLQPFEVASRLSFFLHGSTPSDALLDLAQGGRLGAPAEARAAGAQLLAEARARQRFADFHAYWLGYHQLPFPATLARPMRDESDKLVDRTVFEGTRDYFELFRSRETFVNDALASHYAMPRPGSTTGRWAPYGTAPRQGILSHGAVLAAGAKFDDTSPTLRGIFIRARLLCEAIPEPPPNVDADKPPEAAAGASRCKQERYRAHAAGGCAACHSLLDGVGWGLENFDRQGRYRTVEKDAPECAIEGQGELVGVGRFRGPGELAELLITTGNLERCAVTQLYRFAFGRPDRDADRANLEALAQGFRARNRPFRELVLDLVSSPAFFHRQAEE